MHKHTYSECTGNNLGFSILPKDALVWRLEQLGVKLLSNIPVSRWSALPHEQHPPQSTHPSMKTPVYRLQSREIQVYPPLLTTSCQRQFWSGTGGGCGSGGRAGHQLSYYGNKLYLWRRPDKVTLCHFWMMRSCLCLWAVMILVWTMHSRTIKWAVFAQNGPS